jgi:hypothetical protein
VSAFLPLLLALTPLRAADPGALQAACTAGDAEACGALEPAHSERWTLLESACSAGLAASCLDLAQTRSDDLAARDPRAARAWMRAACGAGHEQACAAVVPTAPVVELDHEGISVNGTVQVRLAGQGRWEPHPSSTDGRLIRPVYGIMTSLAREHQAAWPGGPLPAVELRIHPMATSEAVGLLLHTLDLAGWRSFHLGTTTTDADKLQDAWLPGLGRAAPLDPVLRAAAEARPDGVSLRGVVDPAQIEKGLKAAQPGLKACWDRAVREDPHQGGGFGVRLAIGTGGRVDQAALTRSELGNPSLEACVVRAFEALSFDPPQGGGVAIVDYSLQLSPVWNQPE